MGRNGIHQHGGRIGRLATRDINANPVERRDLLAQDRAIGFSVTPGFQFLVLGVGANARGRRLEGTGHFRRKSLPSRLQRGRRQLQFADGRGLKPVELGGQFQHRVIASLANIAEDGINTAMNLDVRRFVPSQQIA